ncbi:MAG: hypothetical protein WCV72_02855 [Patescibacteria group bacterium]
MSLTKTFSLTLSSFAACVLTASTVFAVGVKPVRTELDIDPGAAVTATIRVINPEAVPITVKPELTVYTKNDEDGYPIVEDLAADDPRNISGWITFDQDAITLAPRSEKSVNFTVTVPDGAEPGGRYASLSYTTVADTETTGIKIQTAVPSLILIKVSGEEIHSGTVKNFALKNEKILSDKGLIFGCDFQNAGNVHEKPRASVSLTDAAGKVLTAVASYADNDSGAVVVADTIPLNLGGGNVLPGSERIFTGEWNHNLRPGKFTAKLTLDYADQPTITQTTEVEIKEGLTLDSFVINQLEKATDFSLTLTNSGNVFERPKGVIEIRNEYDEVVASPQIPDNVAYIAPGSTAVITIPWLEKTVPRGDYTAQLAATFGFADAPLTAEVQFSSNAIDLILLGLIGGGVVIAILLVTVIVLLVRRKKSRHAELNS